MINKVFKFTHISEKFKIQFTNKIHIILALGCRESRPRYLYSNQNLTDPKRITVRFVKYIPTALTKPKHTAVLAKSTLTTVGKTECVF